MNTPSKLIDLSPKALVYSLLLNPLFEPGKSFIAVGAICEPLDFPEYTKEFLKEIIKLGNPIQISTKVVDYDLVLKKVDALISMCIPFDDICKKFELEFCKEIGGGIFLRPILLTIDLETYKKGIEKIAEFTDRMILGNLRLTGDVKKKFEISSLSREYYERRSLRILRREN